MLYAVCTIIYKLLLFITVYHFNCSRVAHAIPQYINLDMLCVWVCTIVQLYILGLGLAASALTHPLNDFCFRFFFGLFRNVYLCIVIVDGGTVSILFMLYACVNQHCTRDIRALCTVYSVKYTRTARKQTTVKE